MNKFKPQNPCRAYQMHKRRLFSRRFVRYALCAAPKKLVMPALEGEFIEFRVYVRRLEDALRSVENPDQL